MNRRAFAAALASLPFVGKPIPAPAASPWGEFIFTKGDRDDRATPSRSLMGRLEQALFMYEEGMIDREAFDRLVNE